MDDRVFFYRIFSHSFIGKLKNGSDLLEFVENGGGSGEFESLWVVKQQQLKVLKQSLDAQETAQSFDYLFLQRVILAGDRCTGGIASVTIQGNAITVMQYEDDNAADCD